MYMKTANPSSANTIDHLRSPNAADPLQQISNAFSNMGMEKAVSKIFSPISLFLIKFHSTCNVIAMTCNAAVACATKLFLYYTDPPKHFKNNFLQDPGSFNTPNISRLETQWKVPKDNDSTDFSRAPGTTTKPTLSTTTGAGILGLQNDG